ncbi:MAG: CvpA family protein [Oscillospiraceae bacterium]|nr:CvpA family protein [Oscillospiraceae bacterium]
MNYALDLVIVVLIIGCAVAGSRKGAVRMLITIAGYIVAVAAAIFVSNVASEYVYEEYIKSAVISALESKSDSLKEEYLSSDKLNEILKENGIVLTDEQLSAITEDNSQEIELPDNDVIRESLNKMFTDYCEALTDTLSGIVPEEILEEAENYLEKNNLETDNMITLITQKKESVISLIEKEIIKPVMLKTVHFVLFSVTFAVIMIIVSIISYAAKIVRKIPVVNSADSFLGTMLGLVQGLLYTGVLNVGVSMFIKFTSDANKYLNTAEIAESYVFRFLYNVTFYVVALILK